MQLGRIIYISIMILGIAIFFIFLPAAKPLEIWTGVPLINNKDLVSKYYASLKRAYDNLPCIIHSTQLCQPAIL